MEDIRCYQNRELSWLKFNERVLVTAGVVERIIEIPSRPDNIYDEDLNYREHMAEVVKLRRKLCDIWAGRA